MSPTEGPIVTALVLLAAAAALFALRTFHLLFRDFRPKYRGRHRHGRVPAPRPTESP